MWRRESFVIESPGKLLKTCPESVLKPRDDKQTLVTTSHKAFPKDGFCCYRAATGPPTKLTGATQSKNDRIRRRTAIDHNLHCCTRTRFPPSTRRLPISSIDTQIPFRDLQRSDLAPSAPAVRSPFDDTRQVEQLDPGVIVVNLWVAAANQTRVRGGERSSVTGSFSSKQLKHGAGFWKCISLILVSQSLCE